MVELHVYFVLTLIVSILTVYSEKTYLHSSQNIQLLRRLKELLASAAGSSDAINGPVMKEARKYHHTQNLIPQATKFPCNVSAGRSKTVPTSVHRLRPGDIDVIAALGDSMAAGSGAFATKFHATLVENRGAAMLGGGQRTWREMLTLPNILKEYNPKLIGYADKDCATYDPASQFNVAEPGARSDDLPCMANNLVRIMKNDPRIDLKTQWKFVGVFIGHNDICGDICWTSSASIPTENYKKNLIEILRILRDNLPRTLVSLVTMMNLKLLTDIKDRPPICDEFACFVCPCLFGRQQEKSLQTMYSWQGIDTEVAAYPEFQRNDFTVTVQTFATNITLPLKPGGGTDFRYFSADCFHPSQRMNAKMSLALWKNLFELPNEKSGFTFDETFEITCPTEHRPYFATFGGN